MTAHAKKSPSDSSRWINCPGCFQEEKRLRSLGLIKEDQASFHAQEGTAAHGLVEIIVERIIDGEFKIDASKYLGRVITVDKKGNISILNKGVKIVEKNVDIFEIDEEMVENCNVFINYFKDLVLGFTGLKRNPTKPLSDYGIDVETEIKVKLSAYGLDDIFGHLDLRVTYGGKVYIIDFKYGKHVPVYAEDNTQLIIYALPVCKDTDIEEVYIVIIQPRCFQVEPVQIWETTPEHLNDWANDVLIPVSKAIDKSTTKLVAGDKQCKWCRCAGHCSAAEEYSLIEVQNEFPDELLSDDEILDVVENFSIDRLSAFMKKIPFINNIIKNVKQKATEVALGGEKLEGFKLVEGKTNRVWIDEEEIEAFLKKSRVKLKDFQVVKIKSPAQLEKIKKLKGKLDDYITKPTGGPTLVPVSDRRKELVLQIEAVEAEIDEFLEDDDDDLLGF